MLTVDGDQVPEMPLLDVADNKGAGEPSQKGAIALKVGVTFGFTVMV